MPSQYRCKHFSIQELVPEAFYNARGVDSWAYLDRGALITLDQLRDKFGSITVNDWVWGGRLNASGLRTFDSEHFNPYSMHSFGKAFDIKFKHTTPLKVQKYILSNPKEFPYIQRLEDAKITKSWLHFDTGNRGYDTPYVFNP